MPPARRQRSWPHRPGSQTRWNPTNDQPNSTCRRQPRRHRRELDIAALQVAAGDRVIQLVAPPAVPASDREMERISPPPRPAPAGSPTGTTGHGQHPDPSRLPSAPPRRERRSRAGGPHLISLEPSGPRGQGGRSHRPDTLLVATSMLSTLRASRHPSNQSSSCGVWCQRAGRRRWRHAVGRAGRILGACPARAMIRTMLRITSMCRSCRRRSSGSVRSRASWWRRAMSIRPRWTC